MSLFIIIIIIILMVILNQILQYAILLFQWTEYNSKSDHLNFLFSVDLFMKTGLLMTKSALRH